MGVDALTRHLVSELTAVGWRAEGETAIDGPTSTTRLTARSKGGSPLTGVLTLARPPGMTAVDAAFRVSRR
jgi:hypothetical protein